jgi:SAM-dependent methyltransferase
MKANREVIMEDIASKSGASRKQATRPKFNPKSRAKMDELFSKHDFVTAYRMSTDAQVEKNPHGAVGGYWEEIGGLQFQFLCDEGLKPQHGLLDIGCGTLRGGRHFIRYLDAGNYFGFDISPKAIEYGQKLVEEEGLAGKRPDLRAIFHEPLRFQQYEAQKFDYLLAQSVFTHLDNEMIEECFVHVRKIMKPDSRFYFTFLNSKEHIKISVTGFSQPYRFYCELADRHGFRVEQRPDYAKAHPRKQHMAFIALA